MEKTIGMHRQISKKITPSKFINFSGIVAIICGISIMFLLPSWALIFSSMNNSENSCEKNNFLVRHIGINNLLIVYMAILFTSLYLYISYEYVIDYTNEGEKFGPIRLISNDIIYILMNLSTICGIITCIIGGVILWKDCFNILPNLVYYLMSLSILSGFIVFCCHLYIQHTK